MAYSITFRKLLAYSVALTFCLLAAFCARQWFLVSNAIPLLDGQVDVDAIKKPVRIERDKNGLPKIHASSREDSAFAMGFLHGQERFFQMDLLRRSASGRLSALLGQQGVEADKLALLFSFVDLANQVLEDLPPSHKALLRAYTSGVNRGLQKLGSDPFEYKALRLAPEKWQEVDSILVVYALFIRLQGHDLKRAINRQRLSDSLPPELFAFLLPESQLSTGSTPLYQVPDADVWDVRNHDVALPESYRPQVSTQLRPASIGWVISKKNNHNTTVVTDINLYLEMPNLWYRAMHVVDSGNRLERFNGVTVPGFPLFFSGTNDHVAWGISLSASHWNYLLKRDKKDTPVTQKQLEVEVNQSSPLQYLVRYTPWGPVVMDDLPGNSMGIWRWVANSPFSVNMGLLELESATSTKDVLTYAAQAKIPHADVFVGDKDGKIGWTLMGALPAGRCLQKRQTCMSSIDDIYPHHQHPQIYDPPKGLISVADVPFFDASTGRHHWLAKEWLGQREKQADDNLFVMYRPNQDKAFQALVDKRNQSLLRWQQLILNVLDEAHLTEHPQLGAFRHFVDQWNGDASSDSTGYLLIRAFQERVAEYVISPVIKHHLAPQQGVKTVDYFMATQRWEQPLWSIIEGQVEHFLNPQFARWSELFSHVVVELDQMFKAEHGALQQASWGKYNQLSFEHVLSPHLNYFNKLLLALPDVSASGDANLAKAQEGNYGAALRLVISPDNESDSLLSMPIGQASNPLSPYWRSGHDDWVNEKPVPLLPGKPHFTLTLNPKHIN